MSDYISRDAAIKAVDDALFYGTSWRDALDAIPATDAIEELQQTVEHYKGCADDWYKEACDYKDALPRWISVKERVPVGGDKSGAICENVNLLLDDGLVTCGWMNGITGKVYYLNALDDFIIKAPISRVTHWMPLPTPPKEAEE